MPIAKVNPIVVKSKKMEIDEVNQKLEVPQVKKSLEPSSSVRSLKRMDDIHDKYKELEQELLKQK